METPPPDRPHDNSVSRTDTMVPAYRVTDMVGPDGRAALLLNEETYLLRITRNGKLILTK